MLIRRCNTGEYRRKTNCYFVTFAHGKIYTYMLLLDEDGMRAVAYAIAPEVQNMELHFDSGSIQVVICEDQIRSIAFACGGSVQIVLSNANVSFEARMEFAEGSGAEGIPEEVRNTLVKEEGR